MTHHRHNNLRFVLVTIHEQRTDGAVNKTANQRFLFRRTTFTLEKATRNAAGCVVFLLVVHGQREEIHAFLWFLCAHNGRQNNGVAIACHHSTIRLASHLARFKA